MKRDSLLEEGVALAARLRERAVPLTVVFAAPPSPTVESELRARRVEVRVLDFAHEWSAAAKLHGWLRDARPALVHFHRLRAGSPVCAAARLAGAHAVVTEHALAKSRGLIERLLASWCDRRVVVSPALGDGDSRAVIEHGVDLDRFLAADPEGVREELRVGDRALVACVARLASEKGIETAIRMMTLLRGRALLAIAGDGDEAPRFRALSAELGLATDVCFLGLCDQVERLYAASDVVIVPSHRDEAFAIAAVEGLAAGKPVVVSDAGVLPALVGDAGLAVPRRDPGALAGAVSRIVDDQALARRLGRAARARALAHFGMSRWLDETLSLYAEVCK